jgi:hypothetical protein
MRISITKIIVCCVERRAIGNSREFRTLHNREDLQVARLDEIRSAPRERQCGQAENNFRGFSILRRKKITPYLACA